MLNACASSQAPARFLQHREGPLAPSEAALALDSLLREMVRATGLLDRILGRGLERLLHHDGLARLGYASLADYANERLGLKGRLAQELAWIERSLPAYPVTARLYSAGRLSHAQVRALLRAYARPGCWPLPGLAASAGAWMGGAVGASATGGGTEVTTPAPTAGCGTEVDAPGPTAGCGTEVDASAPTAGCGTEVDAPGPTAGCGTEVDAPAPTAGCGTEVDAPGPTAGCGTEVDASAPTAACGTAGDRVGMGDDGAEGSGKGAAATTDVPVESAVRDAMGGEEIASSPITMEEVWAHTACTLTVRNLEDALHDWRTGAGGFAPQVASDEERLNGGRVPGQPGGTSGAVADGGAPSQEEPAAVVPLRGGQSRGKGGYPLHPPDISDTRDLCNDERPRGRHVRFTATPLQAAKWYVALEMASRQAARDLAPSAMLEGAFAEFLVGEGYEVLARAGWDAGESAAVEAGRDAAPPGAAQSAAPPQAAGSVDSAGASTIVSDRGEQPAQEAVAAPAGASSFVSDRGEQPAQEAVANRGGVCTLVSGGLEQPVHVAVAAPAGASALASDRGGQPVHVAVAAPAGASGLASDRGEQPAQEAVADSAGASHPSPASGGEPSSRAASRARAAADDLAFWQQVERDISELNGHWAHLSWEVPQVEVPAGLECTPLDDPFEIDRRLVSAVRIKQRSQASVVRLLGQMARWGLFVELEFVRLEQYARERLGMSASSARSLVTLHRRLARCPRTRDAFAAGRIHLTQAQEITRVAQAHTEAAWLQRAAQTTVRFLREDVEEALRLADLAPSAAAGLPPHRCGLEEPAGQRMREPACQTCAPAAPWAGLGPEPPVCQTCAPAAPWAGLGLEPPAYQTCAPTAPRAGLGPEPPVCQTCAPAAPWAGLGLEPPACQTCAPTAPRAGLGPEPPVCQTCAPTAPRAGEGPEPPVCQTCAPAAPQAAEQGEPSSFQRLADVIGAPRPRGSDFRRLLHAVLKDLRTARVQVRDAASRTDEDPGEDTDEGLGVSASGGTEERAGVGTEERAGAGMEERAGAGMEERAGTRTAVHSGRNGWAVHDALLPEQDGSQGRHAARPAPGKPVQPPEVPPLLTLSFWLPASLESMYEEVTAAVAILHGTIPSVALVLDEVLDAYLAQWGQEAVEAVRTHPAIDRAGWRCAVPTCTSRANLQAHHIRYRSRGGSNSLSNLIPLCASHHLHGEHAGYLHVTGTAPYHLLWTLGLCSRPLPQQSLHASSSGPAPTPSGLASTISGLASTASGPAPTPSGLTSTASGLIPAGLEVTSSTGPHLVVQGRRLLHPPASLTRSEQVA